MESISVSVQAKQNIINQNIADIDKQIYNLTINSRVSKLVEDAESVKNIEAQMAKFLKAKDEFNVILGELKTIIEQQPK
jgi:hypothetical protein